MPRRSRSGPPAACPGCHGLRHARALQSSRPARRPASGLIAAGVARVVYAIDDPDPRVDGRGACARLRAAGIDVVCGGLLADECTGLNPASSRACGPPPWVRLKLAASLDGRTALASGESQWISGGRAPTWAGARELGVSPAAAPVLADDPALTVRVGEAPRQPLRVVLDGRCARRRARVLTAGERCSPLEGAADASAAPFGLCPGYASSAAAGRADGAAAGARAGEELAALQMNECWVEAGPTLAGALRRRPGRRALVRRADLARPGRAAARGAAALRAGSRTASGASRPTHRTRIARYHPAARGQ